LLFFHKGLFSMKTENKKAETKTNNKIFNSVKTITPLLIVFLIITLLSTWSVDQIWRSGYENLLSRQDNSWNLHYTETAAKNIEERINRINSALENLVSTVGEWYEDGRSIPSVNLIPRGKAWHYPGGENASEILVYSNKAILNDLLGGAGGNEFDANMRGLIITDPSIDAVGLITMKGVLRRIPGDRLVDKVRDLEQLHNLKSVRESATTRGRSAAWYTGGELSTSPSPQPIGASWPVIIEGSIVSILFIEMDGGQLLPQMTHTDQEWSMIVDSKGRVVALDSLGAVLIGRTGTSLNNHPVHSISELGKQVVQRIRGEETIMSRYGTYFCHYLPIGNTGWKLVTGREKIDLASKTQNLSVISLVVTIVLSLVAILVFWLSLKYIQKKDNESIDKHQETLKKIEKEVKEIGKDVPLSLSTNDVDELFHPLVSTISNTARFISDDYRNATRKTSRLQLILNSLDNGVAMMDRQFKVVYANNVIMERHGYGIVGQGAGWILEKTSWNTASYAKEAMTEKTPVNTRRKVKISGEERVYQVTYFPIINILGKVEGFGESSVDITEIAALQEELKKDQRAGEVKTYFDNKFISGISRELQTPLSKLSSQVKLVSNKVDQMSESCIDIISEISESTDRLEDLLSSVGELAKLEAGSKHVALSVFPAKDLLEATVAKSRGFAVMKNVELTLGMVRSSTMLKSDAGILGIILGTLTHNAIKFANGGVVDLSLKKEEKHQKITVHDNGPGMNQELVDWIHKQNDLDKTEILYFKDGGIRLGLTLVVRLVKLLEGKLLVSTSSEDGTTISVLIPSV